LNTVITSSKGPNVLCLCKQCRCKGGECWKGREYNARENTDLQAYCLMVTLLSIWDLNYYYLLIAWRIVLLEKLVGFKLVKKFPQFCGYRRFNAAVTVSRRLFLFWPRLIQSMSSSHFPKIRFNIIHPSMPVYCKWALSPRFPYQNPVYTFPLSHTWYMPRLSLLWSPE